MRKLMLIGTMATLMQMQGCATNFDTFVAGSVVGAIIGGTVAACSRNCY